MNKKRWESYEKVEFYIDNEIKNIHDFSTGTGCTGGKKDEYETEAYLHTSGTITFEFRYSSKEPHHFNDYAFGIGE